jgi:hypothetical protein
MARNAGLGAAAGVADIELLNDVAQDASLRRARPFVLWIDRWLGATLA